MHHMHLGYLFGGEQHPEDLLQKFKFPVLLSNVLKQVVSLPLELLVQVFDLTSRVCKFLLQSLSILCLERDRERMSTDIKEAQVCGETKEKGKGQDKAPGDARRSRLPPARS